MLTLLFCVGVGIALANMYSLSSRLIETQARQNAALYLQTLDEAVDLYIVAAVDRLEANQGVAVTHDYFNQKGAIPLPSTFAIELGQRISQQEAQLASVRLYSDYPFPWRKSEGGPKNDFEAAALKQLRENPQQPFAWTETDNGNVMFRYSKAILMQPTCVDCHNTDPSSPFKAWRVGDVGGAWVVNQPLDSLVAQVNRKLRSTFVTLGGLSALGIAGLTLVVGKLRQTTRQLEFSVQERTQDLAKTNSELQQRNQLLRQVFGRYLSNEVVTNLLASPSRLELGGDRRTVTILTSDLRGFTTLSERLSPEEVIHILNLYLERMADVINRYQGTIDEFMGDGILVLFGAPRLQPDDALRAVACACAMQLAMGGVNEQMRQMGLPLEMGIGIHTGEVVVGNIGSEQRTKYGVVGSPVNLTYRIESYTRGGQILISAATLQAAGPAVKTQGLRQVQPKGVQTPITVYDVYGVGGAYSLYLPKEEEQFYPIEPIPLRYTLLTDKQVGQDFFKGRLTQLSEKGAEIQIAATDSLPSELTNLKLKLQIPDLISDTSEDLYAKVTNQQPEQHSIRVYFTSVSPGLKRHLEALHQVTARSAD